MQLVIDTNIIVSALLSADSNAFKVLSDALDGKYTVLISEEIFQEYQDVLHREKFGFDEEIISFLLEWFKENAIWIEISKSNIPMKDEKDRVFYDLANSCKARLVTGNIKHYLVDELVTALWELIEE